MAYYVKKCAYCGAENHPSEITCLKCGKDLPEFKTESANEPLTRPKSAIAPDRRGSLSPAGAYDSNDSENQPQAIPVIVMDVNMKFASMVGFMVKWAIATIPALIILIIFGVFAFAIIGSIKAP